MKRCPHLFWEWYITRRPPQKSARRRICRLAGYMPSYLSHCPLDVSRGSI